MTDVVVVGAGVAGLATTYELVRQGRTVRLLEAAPRAGGVILTERFDGWVIDGGPDSLLVQKPAAVALCRELGLGDQLVPTLTPRTAYVLREGQLHPIPEGSFLGFPLTARALLSSSLFSARGKLRMACETLLPRGPQTEDESVAAFVRRRFGDEAVDYLAEPLLAGIHAGDVDRLSVRALFPRLVEAERRSGSVLRSFRALRARPARGQSAFVSLTGGVAALTDALVGALPEGTLTTSAPVTRVRRGRTFVTESSAGALESRAVVLATPAYVTGALVRAHDPALAEICEAVPYASTATVALGYRREHVGHPLRGTGFVVPRIEGNPLLAGTWVTSKWPGRAPEGHVLLRGFLGGGRDPRRLDASDGELVETAREALSSLLDITGPPAFSRLFRWTRQSPQYEVGHLARLARIEHGLSTHPGLFVAGSAFRAIGIPDCVGDGRTTAGRVVEFLSTGKT